MPKYEVWLCAKFIVEAEIEDEAIDEAFDALKQELDSPYVGLEDIFKAKVESVKTP